jgi:hypothetical protein
MRRRAERAESAGGLLSLAEYGDNFAHSQIVGGSPDPRRAPWLGCRTRGSDAGEGARPTI